MRARTTSGSKPAIHSLTHSTYATLPCSARRRASSVAQGVLSLAGVSEPNLDLASARTLAHGAVAFRAHKVARKISHTLVGSRRKSSGYGNNGNGVSTTTSVPDLHSGGLPHQGDFSIPEGAMRSAPEICVTGFDSARSSADSGFAATSDAVPSGNDSGVSRSTTETGAGALPLGPTSSVELSHISGPVVPATASLELGRHRNNTVNRNTSSRGRRVVSRYRRSTLSYSSDEEEEDDDVRERGDVTVSAGIDEAPPPPYANTSVYPKASAVAERVVAQ